MFLLSSLTLLLVIILCCTIISKDASNDNQKQFDQLTWGLANGTLIVWLITILYVLIAVKFNINKFIKQNMFYNFNGLEFTSLTIFGGLILSSMIVDKGKSTENNVGMIDSSANNLAIIGLVLPLWMIMIVIYNMLF